MNFPRIRDICSSAFCLKAWRDALLFMIGFTLYLYFLHTDLMRWIAVRDLLIMTVILVSAQTGAGHTLCSKFWQPAWVPFFLYLGIYPYVWGATSTEIPFQRMRPELYAAFFLMLGMGLVLAWIEKIHAGRAWAVVYGLAVTVFSLFPVLYMAHYILYGARLDSDTMMAVLTTNPEEASEFISHQTGWGLFAGAAAGCLAYIGVHVWMAGRRRQYAVLTERKTGHRYFFVFLSILTVWGMIHYMGTAFPFQQIADARSYLTDIHRFQQQYDRNAENIRLVSSSPAKGTVILVVGESETRDHMKAFTPSYPSDTTPWMTSTVSQPGYFLFSRAYSNFPQTIPSLSMYLTSSNQYNGQDLADSVSIMDIARMKGYRTYWIGNHSRSATGNTPVSVIAQRAQQVYWTKNAPEYDENIMPFLKQIPAEGANFVVIHIMGSHVQYTNRVPDDFMYQGQSEGGENGTDYDRTVAYTDQILHEIFEYARQNMNLQVMVYAPDHGEDMHYGHGTSRFLFDMVRIPLWIYLSPAYRAAYPENADMLKNHENAYFTNDLMFDTVSGLIWGQSNYYASRYDLSSPDYSLPLEEARTLHGRRAISEDPALHS